MSPDLNSLPPSRSPVNSRQPPSPRSSSVSLAAAASINAGIQQQDSRRSSISSRSNHQPTQAGRRERGLSNVALNLNDPSLPGPGELQSSEIDQRARGSSISQQFRTSSPQGLGSPTTAPPHHRSPSLGELHQELEQEQEAQVVSHVIVDSMARKSIRSRCQLYHRIAMHGIECSKADVRTAEPSTGNDPAATSATSTNATACKLHTCNEHRCH